MLLLLIEAGCSMRKVKSRKYKKQKLILLLVAIVLGFGCSVRSFNMYMEPQLQAIAKQHTGFAINNIVKEVLADIEYDTDALFKINRTKSGDISSIEYDSYKLNQLLYSALNTIDKSLLAAQDGKKDPTTKDVFYEDGVLYEVPAGYLSHIFFLYDKGPKIRVRMRMLNDVTGEIKTESKPYGINNTMIKISLVVKVNAQVITFLSTSELETKTEIPLVVQIVNGQVPDFAPYSSSSGK